MPFCGIIWASIICIPFWLIVIFLVNAGGIALETLVFVGLVLSVLTFLYIFPSVRNSIKDKRDDQPFIPTAKVRPLDNLKIGLKDFDNGGNRSGIDRRIFKYSTCIPERRSGRDRREGYDRRNSMVRRRESERRNIFKST